MDLVFFGIQGSGKGTQAKRLADDLDYYVFEAGGELRAMAASGTELGNTVKSYIDEGHLVPFEIIMKVVKEAIAAQPESQQILFDGIPRDGDQMDAFNDIMKELGREFVCIHILLEKEESLRRIEERAEKEGRADDADQEKVLRRIDLFFEKTMPVIQHYEGEGKVREIDGNGSIDDIYERITQAVKEEGQ